MKVTLKTPGREFEIVCGCKVTQTGYGVGEDKEIKCLSARIFFPTTF